MKRFDKSTILSLVLVIIFFILVWIFVLGILLGLGYLPGRSRIFALSPSQSYTHSSQTNFLDLSPGLNIIPIYKTFLSKPLASILEVSPQ